MIESLDGLHDRLRARVKAILAKDVKNEEEREVRLMGLYAAYERYGNDADKLRGITQ